MFSNHCVFCISKFFNSDLKLFISSLGFASMFHNVGTDSGSNSVSKFFSVVCDSFSGFGIFYHKK